MCLIRLCCCTLSPCLREQGTLKMKYSIWNQIIAPLSTHVMVKWLVKWNILLRYIIYVWLKVEHAINCIEQDISLLAQFPLDYVFVCRIYIFHNCEICGFRKIHFKSPVAQQHDHAKLWSMSDLSVNNINLTKLTKYYNFLIMII